MDRIFSQPLLHFCRMNEHFPQFRKLANEKSYYQIDSEEKVIEIQRMGDRWTSHELHAKILPERLHIADMLNGMQETYLTVTREEFETFRKHCEEYLLRF